jgi:hypothetical protein
MLRRGRYRFQRVVGTHLLTGHVAEVLTPQSRD